MANCAKKKIYQILRHYVILLSQLELAYEKISPRVAPFALEPLYEMKAKTQDTTSWYIITQLFFFFLFFSSMQAKLQKNLARTVRRQQPINTRRDSDV